MGSWGTALYSNDTASDVRDICNEVYPLVGIEKGKEIIFREYEDLLDTDKFDNEYASFWYALADWQWKHGILTDDVKDKAVELLSSHTGIDEWQEDGTTSDVHKRIKVMDDLLLKLNSPMPPVKIPKAKMQKAKHKIGDIVIVRTCGEDYKYDDSIWSILSISEASDIYKPDVADKIPKFTDLPYKAYNKYMALLCVDIMSEPHSQYVEGFYDERSVYAIYDYLSDEKPSFEMLKRCGFLPTYTRYCVINTAKTECCRWDYKTTILCCDFKLSARSEFSSIDKINGNTDEVERFEKLLGTKAYSKEYTYGFSFYEVFYSFFKEKIRLEFAGIPYDNLLCETIHNPPILTPAEVDAMTKEESKKWIAELEAKLANK